MPPPTIVYRSKAELETISLNNLRAYGILLHLHKNELDNYLTDNEDEWKQASADWKRDEDRAIFGFIGGASLALIDPTFITVIVAWAYSSYDYLLDRINRELPESLKNKIAYDAEVSKYESAAKDYNAVAAHRLKDT